MERGVQVTANQLCDDLAERVLEQIPTPVMAVNNDFQIIFMNAAGRAVIDMPWAEM